MYYAIFSFLFIISLFFGEIRQGSIEIFWCIGLGILSLISLVFQKKSIRRVLPNSHVFAILFLVVAFFSSLPFSRDLGYALSIGIRLFLGIIIYVFTYQTATKNDLHRAVSIILIAGGCVSIVALVCRMAGLRLPFVFSMNLIFSQTGHNHGAYFLLFLLPAAVWYTKIFKKPWGISILLGITAAILTSFSRAVLGVAIAYGIFILKTAKLLPGTKRIVQSMVFFSLLMGFVMYLFSYTPDRIKTRLPLSGAVKAQFYKSTLAEESRFSDWKQAIQGFLTSPLTGTGPGTFWLTSKQFQTTRMSASAFAHSAPLQLLSEQGLLGFLAWGYISIIIGKKLLALRKKTIAEPETSQKTATLALVDGIILSFTLSLFSYNLDYLSLSLLIWLSVGLLLGVNSEQKGNQKTYPYLIMLLVIPCLVYALVTLYGTSLWKWASTNEQGAKLLSYQTNRMEIYLEARKFTHQPISPSVINLILLFHKDNPDIASLLASLSPSPFDFETQNQLFQKSILRNPLNTVNYDAYMKFLLENHRYIGTGEVYQMLIKTTLRILGKPYPQSLDFRDPHIVTLYTPEFMEIIKSRGSQREILSKSLYILGLRELPTNPSFTKQVWDLASVISPDWSYFAIERASYALYINDSSSEAKGILTACAKRYSPSKACTDLLSIFPSLPEPGSYEKAILYIPGIL